MSSLRKPSTCDLLQYSEEVIRRRRVVSSGKLVSPAISSKPILEREGFWELPQEMAHGRARVIARTGGDIITSAPQLSAIMQSAWIGIGVILPRFPLGD